MCFVLAGSWLTSWGTPGSSTGTSWAASSICRPTRACGRWRTTSRGRRRAGRPAFGTPVLSVRTRGAGGRLRAHGTRTPARGCGLKLVPASARAPAAAPVCAARSQQTRRAPALGRGPCLPSGSWAPRLSRAQGLARSLRSGAAGLPPGVWAGDVEQGRAVDAPPCPQGLLPPHPQAVAGRAAIPSP